MSRVLVFFTNCRWEADSASQGSVRGDVYSARVGKGAGGLKGMLKDVEGGRPSANLQLTSLFYHLQLQIAT